MLSTRPYLHLSILFASIACALKPTPTGQARNDPNILQEWTPITTSPPLLTHNHLRRAPNLETCGYTNGDASSPNVCGTSSKCAFFGSPNYYFGCCATTSGTFGSDCYSVGACLPWTSASAEGFTNNGASIYSNSVVCGSGAPNCATTYIDGVPNVEGPRTHFDCVTDEAAEYRLSQDPTTQAVSTQVKVSVVQVTVAAPTTSTTASSSSSTSSSSATPAATSGGAEGTAYHGNTGLTKLAAAVIAGIVGLL